MYHPVNRVYAHGYMVRGEIHQKGSLFAGCGHFGLRIVYAHGLSRDQ